jgi:heptosyltransferase-2
VSHAILIVGPAWVGDMVMAQSLFMTLKRVHPYAAIDVLAPGWTAPLLARMPEVRRAIMTPFAHGSLNLTGRWRFGRSLAAEGYDQAIVLPNSFKSALVPWFAGIKRRTGWRGELRRGLLNDVRVLDKAALPLMIDRFNALAFDKGAVQRAADFPAAHPAPKLAVDPEAAAAARTRFGLTADRPALALCPGAEFGAAKRWPERHYAELAAGKIAEGWQVWLFGSTKDAAVAAAISAQVPGGGRAHCHELAGKTTLAEAIDLLSLAAAVATNDSGLMHVAAALDRKLVAIYGPTSPGFTPPLNADHRIANLQLACSPCFKRECPLGHHNCLEQLPAGRVAGLLDELGAAP